MRKRPDDRGFTLIELAITIAVLGIITLPLGNFVIAYFRNYTQTVARFSESHDVQIAAAYFAQDVANVGVRPSLTSTTFVQSVWTADPGSACGSGSGTMLLLLRWNGPGDAGYPSAHSVAYVAKTDNTLHRVYCASGSAPTSDATVAHNLVYPDAGNSAPVTCKTLASDPDSSASTATCTAVATPPAVIRLTLSLQASGDTSIVTPRPVLTGQRRQQS